MYIVKVDGMTVKLCRSFNEAKRLAKKKKGKVYTYGKEKLALPKSSTLSYNSPEYLKREVYREIYSENNHGYHFTKYRLCGG